MPGTLTWYCNNIDYWYVYRLQGRCNVVHQLDVGS